MPNSPVFVAQGEGAALINGGVAVVPTGIVGQVTAAPSPRVRFTGVNKPRRVQYGGVVGVGTLTTDFLGNANQVLSVGEYHINVEFFALSCGTILVACTYAYWRIPAGETVQFYVSY